ncbi:MAG TPA: acyltransferase family protein [Noviherbaspirillum sp.]
MESITIANNSPPAHAATDAETKTRQPHVVDADRVGWVDFAKAICIVAVVTMYSTHHVQAIMNSTGWMQAVVDFAQPFRMPDFFLIAGLFVSRVLNRPLRSYIDSKVLYFFYFYAVWVTFRFTFMNIGGLLGEDRLALLPAYLHLYIDPPSGPLWFIYVLALFFIAVRVLRGIPAWLVLTGAAAIQVAHIETGITFFDKFTYYFVFFYAGYLFAPQIFRLAEWAQPRALFSIAILVIWFVGNGALVESGIAQLPGMSLILGFAGAFAVMLLATLLARAPGMKWFSYLGKNSIVVYLGFVIPLGFMRWFIGNSTLVTDVGNLALIATVLSVAGAIAMFWAFRKTPLSFLFVRPAWTHIGPVPSSGMKKRASPTGSAV